MTYQQPPQSLAETLATATDLAERQTLNIRQLTNELEELQRAQAYLLESLRHARLLAARDHR